MKQLHSATFKTAFQANEAIDKLISYGVAREDISVLMSRETHDNTQDQPASGESKGTLIVKDAASGGLIGGALGAIIAGSLAATGAIGAAIITGGAAAPLIAGPLAAALAGGGAGAAAGGVLGALTGYGISEEQAHRLAKEVDAGNIVVAVKANETNMTMVESILGQRPLTRV